MWWNKKEPKKVFVALSGGVDSSVSATLLQKQGYEVTGVYIKGWYPDWKECSWKESRRDAMRVCAGLNIPFQTLDLSKEYKKEVVDYFLEEYQKGRTPNPDVMCNKHIKFGKFYDYAFSEGADFVATGHYAQIQNGKLLRGQDKNKDQSYFLWTLKKEQLSKILFPVGGMLKTKVRSLARKYNLVTKAKKDSQGICFLEDVSMEDFLKHYFPAKPGDVLDENYQRIGFHDGAILYTIGQRHGFRTANRMVEEKPYFVIAKDLDKNTITVSRERAWVKKGQRFSLESTNWLQKLKDGEVYEAQARYRQAPFGCNFVNKKVVLEQPAELPVSGQSLVIYDKDVCLGGGVIN